MELFRTQRKVQNTTTREIQAALEKSGGGVSRSTKEHKWPAWLSCQEKAVTVPMSKKGPLSINQTAPSQALMRPKCYFNWNVIRKYWKLKEYESCPWDALGWPSNGYSNRFWIGHYSLLTSILLSHFDRISNVQVFVQDNWKFYRNWLDFSKKNWQLYHLSELKISCAIITKDWMPLLMLKGAILRTKDANF